MSIEGGEDLDKLVGPRGTVLEALQELTRLAVQQETGTRSRLMLDIAGWRAGRREELRDLGRATAESVLSSGERVRLQPMTPVRAQGRARRGGDGEGRAQRERGRGPEAPRGDVPGVLSIRLSKRPHLTRSGGAASLCACVRHRMRSSTSRRTRRSRASSPTSPRRRGAGGVRLGGRRRRGRRTTGSREQCPRALAWVTPSTTESGSRRRSAVRPGTRDRVRLALERMQTVRLYAYRFTTTSSGRSARTRMRWWRRDSGGAVWVRRSRSAICWRSTRRRGSSCG